MFVHALVDGFVELADLGGPLADSEVVGVAVMDEPVLGEPAVSVGDAMEVDSDVFQALRIESAGLAPVEPPVSIKETLVHVDDPALFVVVEVGEVAIAGGVEPVCLSVLVAFGSAAVVINCEVVSFGSGHG